jgi:hypothetical protein
MLILKLFISALLLINLDEYIEDHINITKSILLLISLKHKFRKRFK